MNWDAIGAVGEILGALGVIATLAYLAVQIRQNTKATKITNYNEAMHHMTAMLTHITKDEEISRVWRLGREASPELSVEDLERFSNLLLTYFHHIQAEYLSYKEGMCDEGVWLAQARETSHFLNFAGFEREWIEHSPRLDTSFVDYINIFRSTNDSTPTSN